jgi:hypothetical protein
MRRSAIPIVLIIASLGVATMLVSYEVRDREEKLAAIHREILAHQEAIHVLEAEWSFLNRPDRLEALVRRHLEMVPLDISTQLGALETLPIRLDIPAGDVPSGAGKAAVPGETARAPQVPPLLPPAPLPRPVTISLGDRR